jgi:hypothetical protein
MQSKQLSLFPQAATAKSTGIIGLVIEMPTACACGATAATVGSSAGPHAASLICECGRFAGWLPRRAAEFIASTIDTFGQPTKPIALRGFK